MEGEGAGVGYRQTQKLATLVRDLGSGGGRQGKHLGSCFSYTGMTTATVTKLSNLITSKTTPSLPQTQWGPSPDTPLIPLCLLSLSIPATAVLTLLKHIGSILSWEHSCFQCLIPSLQFLLAHPHLAFSTTYNYFIFTPFFYFPLALLLGARMDPSHLAVSQCLAHSSCSKNACVNTA
ncbi:unnamed protein product [Rangifer tarandus platyrhynchus]|uniref:Uncharacterized protein n=2 Tax=Rangifer tarandus platyrhynchus TaxID=3082113 RepID=A0AC59ZGL2_RANTA|nr:unnamed protein product [Rangifer tarandus platyrhynchus]